MKGASATSELYGLADRGHPPLFVIFLGMDERSRWSSLCSVFFFFFFFFFAARFSFLRERRKKECEMSPAVSLAIDILPFDVANAVYDVI